MVPKQSHMGKMTLDYKIENTWGPDSYSPLQWAEANGQMKHFHLSQGDKLAGLMGLLFTKEN